MIISDKILSLRKKLGFSQEELAEKLGVSRQSVSKWESAVSVPDINKIIEMSRLFGVSTDFLLKDEEVLPEYLDSEEPQSLRRLSAENVSEYIEVCKDAARKVALGVVMCILSPIVLLFLGSLTQPNSYGVIVSDEVAAGLGVGILLLSVAAAVVIFITSGGREKYYSFIKEGEFELDYGVSGILQERQRIYSPKQTKRVAFSIALFILAVVPLISVAVAGAAEEFLILMVILLIILVAVGVYILIRFGAEDECYKQLLREEEYAPSNSENRKRSERFGGIFWPLAVAVYLIWSFVTNDWHITWVVWPAAGLIFGSIMALTSKNK